MKAQLLLIETIAQMRAMVGFLGERDQYAWWQSTFLSGSSKAFLAPVFDRTWVQAASVGVTQAAALMHDERIGIGQVYHLFRLPEDLESAVYRAFRDQKLCAEIISKISSRETALDYLKALSKPLGRVGVGPTRIGSIAELRKAERWGLVSAQYAQAFKSSGQVYPYFSDVG